MPWPIDNPKLERVQQFMAQHDLDALVARAPRNVLSPTNHWDMKRYDAVFFPRQGQATLIVLEPQLEDAHRNSWTRDLRLFSGYDERDPRPPQFRALDISLKVLRERGLTRRVGLELSQGTQSADRMVGEPTVFSKNFFDAFATVAGEVVDATPLLIDARAIKTSQEIERMRL